MNAAEVTPAGLVAKAAAGRSRWSCAAPASFRPVSPVVFVQVCEGISSCEQIERAVRSGPFAARGGLRLPPARDRGARPARGRPRPGVETARRLLVPASGSSACTLYEHGPDRVWRTQRLVRLRRRDACVKALLARLKASHAYRSWQRYSDARGNVLAGGVAYLGFFSIIPALVLGFTVFGFVLRGQPELFDRVVSYVSRTLPGILRDSAHPDGILDASAAADAERRSRSPGAISLVTLLLSGLGWVDALRQGVRAMFERAQATRPTPC